MVCPCLQKHLERVGSGPDRPGTSLAKRVENDVSGRDIAAITTGSHVDVRCPRNDRPALRSQHYTS